VIAEGTRAVAQDTGNQTIKKLKENKINYVKFDDYSC
jgi:hypothetical protein